jgi:hypothetical protein
MTVWRNTRSIGRPIPRSDAIDSVETNSARLGVVVSPSTTPSLLTIRPLGWRAGPMLSDSVATPCRAGRTDGAPHSPRGWNGYLRSANMSQTAD